MKLLKSKPYFIFLLVLFFILHGTVENFGFIYFTEIIKISLVILCCVWAFYLLLKFFIKKTIPAAIICFFTSAWILFFGAIFDWVKTIHFLHWLHSYTVFVPFMLCTIIIFILFIGKRIKLQNKLCFYLNVLLLIYCAIDITALFFKSIKPTNYATADQVSFDTALIKTKPNIYFLLFDEYPGYKSLKDSFAFSNDQLYQFLEKKEFKVLPTFSNYNMTFYSMASMLNMHYIDSTYKPLENTMEDDQQRIKEIKHAQCVQYLKSIGYSFKNYSIFDILDQPSVKGNSFVISQATLITHKIFFNKILYDLGWHFISGKYSLPFVKHIYMQEDRNNKFIEKELTNITFQNTYPPQFIYAHFNLPHSPIFNDSAGNYLPTAKIFDRITYADKKSVLSYIKFANKKIESLVDVIGKRDTNAIIIVMSDHGYRNYKNRLLIEPLNFDNICAVRFPDKNYLPMKDKWSNVNFFRYLFNCEFNQKMPYLGDSSIFLKDKKIND